RHSMLYCRALNDGSVPALRPMTAQRLDDGVACGLRNPEKGGHQTERSHEVSSQIAFAVGSPRRAIGEIRFRDKAILKQDVVTARPAHAKRVPIVQVGDAGTIGGQVCRGGAPRVVVCLMPTSHDENVGGLRSRSETLPPREKPPTIDALSFRHRMHEIVARFCDKSRQHLVASSNFSKEALPRGRLRLP